MIDFSDIFENGLETTASEIFEENEREYFATWFDDVIKYKDIEFCNKHNISKYELIYNDITLYFLKNKDNNIIYCPITYLIKSPYIISYIDIEEHKENIIFYLYCPFILSENNIYELTMLDVDKLSVLENKIKFNKILINAKFSDINVYYKFVETIYDIFKIYPEFSYLTIIKDDKKDKYITEFINSDKIPKNKILFDNNVKIYYKNCEE